MDKKFRNSISVAIIALVVAVGGALGVLALQSANGEGPRICVCADAAVCGPAACHSCQKGICNIEECKKGVCHPSTHEASAAGLGKSCSMHADETGKAGHDGKKKACCASKNKAGKKDCAKSCKHKEDSGKKKACCTKMKEL